MTTLTAGLVVAVTIAFLSFVIGYSAGQARRDKPPALIVQPTTTTVLPDPPPPPVPAVQPVRIVEPDRVGRHRLFDDQPPGNEHTRALPEYKPRKKSKEGVA